MAKKGGFNLSYLIVMGIIGSYDSKKRFNLSYLTIMSILEVL